MMAYMNERDWRAVVRDLTAERAALAAEVRRLRGENAELRDGLIVVECTCIDCTHAATDGDQ